MAIVDESIYAAGSTGKLLMRARFVRVLSSVQTSLPSRTTVVVFAVGVWAVRIHYKCHEVFFVLFFFFGLYACMHHDSGTVSRQVTVID